MTLKMRIAIEQLIAEKTVDALLAAGFTVTVNDGEDDVISSTTKETILKNMFSTDEDVLFVDTGWVKFIYGNSGWDVINDYTTNLEDTLKPVMELAELIDDGNFVIEVKPTPYAWNNGMGWGKLAPKEDA